MRFFAEAFFENQAVCMGMHMLISGPYSNRAINDDIHILCQ
jgi:hypothetical protein